MNSDWGSTASLLSLVGAGAVAPPGAGTVPGAAAGAAGPVVPAVGGAACGVSGVASEWPDKLAASSAMLYRSSLRSCQNSYIDLIRGIESTTPSTSVVASSPSNSAFTYQGAEAQLNRN